MDIFVDDPNADNLALEPRRRNQVDDGADSNAAAGHPPGKPRRRNRPSRDARHCGSLPLAPQLPLAWLPVEQPSAATAAPAAPSDHPGAGRTGGGRRVRQSLFYSRRPQRRRPSRHVGHPSEVSSAEPEVTNLPSHEALPESGAAGFHPNHPGAEEEAVSGTRIRQSVLYSNRPRRARHSYFLIRTEEHPSEVRSSEFGGPVTDLTTLEALSLSDPPPLTPQITGEEGTTDDDDESSHLYGPEDVGYSVAPSGLLTRSMLLSLGDSLFIPMEEIEMRKRDPDKHTKEELERMRKEYDDKHPPLSIEEAFERIVAVEYATLSALAAENGTEPPRNPFLVDQEAQSLQGQQQDPAAAAHPQDSMAVSHEASAGVIKDGKKWMRDEVTLCFRKHVEKTPYLAGLVFELDELCHQCFNVENYMKVFHHYNFKVKMKMPASLEWTVELYFGEVKEMFGRKFYFCCPLEPNESGHCYACKNQGVEDLKHPVTGGFEKGLPDSDDDE